MKTARYSLFFALALMLFSCSDRGTDPDPTFYEVSVTVTPDSAGTISPAADSSYEAGSRISLQANTKDGYQFTGWSGDLESTANPLSLTIDRDYTLTANFTKAEKQFYLHENGVTILCPDAEPGQKGVVGGVEYVAVDRQQLETYEGLLSKVCTSPVANMASLFAPFDYEFFDGDLSSWDVSNVTRMDSMFYGSRVFDSDLSKWDVSSVKDMSSMFEWTDSFNGDISSWNVSNVTDMGSMFRNAEAFNQDISNWDVSNVTDMSDMFRDADFFGQDLNGWDVTQVTDMSGMFSGSLLGGPSPFDGDIGDWDVSNVAKMDSMFFYATSFNRDIKDWNVGNVKDMSYMFHSAENFNQDLNKWDVSNVRDMSNMFAADDLHGSGVISFNGNISRWDVGNVTDMRRMFSSAENFNQDLSGWCVEKITEEPDCFSCESSLIAEHHPVWGTCPR